MAKRIARSGLTGKKRMLFLGGTAFIAIALVAAAMVQENKEESKRAAAGSGAVTEQQPNLYYNDVEESIGKNGTSTADGRTAASAPNSSGKAGEAANPEEHQNSKIFNFNDNNDSKYPVTGKAGSSNPKSSAQQQTGEQLIAGIASGTVGDSFDDRNNALKKALTAYEKAVQADPNNEAAQYGLGYARVNLAASYFTTVTKADNHLGTELQHKALKDFDKARDISRTKGNAAMLELAELQYKSISAALNSK